MRPDGGGGIGFGYLLCRHGVAVGMRLPKPAAVGDVPGIRQFTAALAEW